MTRFDPLRVPMTGTHLVEAGAGTGKTWGLTALYLRLIAEGRHRPRDVAVVTFTEAATRELRSRVRDRLVLLAQRMASPTPSADPVVEALAQRMADEPGARTRIERAALELDDATIATIHGFCRRVLSDFALDAAQPFATLDPDDGSLMRARAVRDCWRRFVVAGDPAEADWVLSWLASSDALVKWIEEALRVPPERVTPHVDPAELAGLHAALDAQRAQAPRAALLRAARDLGSTSALSRSAAAHSPYHDATFARLVAELHAWLEHARQDAPVEAISAFTTACVASRRNPRRGVGWEPAEPAVLAWADAALSAALDHAYARRSAFLQRVLADVRASIATQKCEQRVLSFDDLVGDLRDVLAASPDVVEAIRARHAVALVDEFQDTDADQYAIFRALFHDRADGALYLIGDPKQAIYRFRGGDVFAYRAAARDAGENLWTLDDNWRSDERLIEAVNALFDERRAVRPFVHEFITFRRAGYGVPRTRPPAMSPIDAPLVVWTHQAEDAQAKGELAARIHDAVAAEVEKLLAAPHARGAPSIAVLVRDKYEVAGAVAALGRRGIGTSYTSAQSVYDEPEAAELATVLDALA
ncbi:MAG TPA: UvrD-helicase domain-containing protein, partial [Candidatus Saccharimonadia bacterium]|nr:UvrD-helicase domain-containing protein [Candidatus Saccharimonadia bacterium]